MAPEPNRAGNGASTSGTAKDEAAAKKKIESEDLVSPKPLDSNFHSVLGFKFLLSFFELNKFDLFLLKFMQSDEDLALKQQLELYVERVQDTDPGLQKVALESMR